MNKAFKFIAYMGDIALFLILGFYTALFCFIFHLGWAVDIITVDTPHEEHMIIPFREYIMYFILGSLVLSVYIYNLFGHLTYKKLKIAILSFILCLSILLSAIELISMVILFRTMPIQFYISQLTVLIFPLLLMLVITKKYRELFKWKIKVLLN
ncbi:hypothetical protein JOC25_001291 [Solibacillus kalamii]|uniref:Uncharacterized protein n=1 Tax=Solibacillus kalamii TaxID=1748298 RepID=A0ABX3ZMS8_9BACL|nr:hypothetical protein [Solibacillus kalamii]MBM7664832.1 hypothetical protein [Solibacillus kalamii]OUZ40792.1 hypothetical protein CBM15_02660 [Solibacillus kalamii]